MNFRDWFKRWSIRLPVLALTALAAAAAVGEAAAHARYDHSTPQQGEVVAASPARVDIYTAQDMKKEQGADVITVTDGGGAQVDSSDSTVDDADRKHFSVGLKLNLPPGRYLVAFKNVADEDGEADHGQFAFYVGAGPTAAQSALDAKLAITSKTEAAPKSDSHTGLIIGIVVAVVVVLLIASGGFAMLRRRRA